jgi:hypothetical protein
LVEDVGPDGTKWRICWADGRQALPNESGREVSERVALAGYARTTVDYDSGGDWPVRYPASDRQTKQAKTPHATNRSSTALDPRSPFSF